MSNMVARWTALAAVLCQMFGDARSCKRTNCMHINYNYIQLVAIAIGCIVNKLA